MCDFLVCLSKQYSGERLLALLKIPYGEHSPEGKYFDFPWGSIAILDEKLAGNNNIYQNNNYMFAWVGDLVMDVSADTVAQFSKRINDINNLEIKDSINLEQDELFKKLNGAFAILIVHEKGFSIITDPMNFTPVYKGVNIKNDIVSFGTHADLVASVSRDKICLDKVSAAEYLSYGNSTFPNTMHSHVKEVNPGKLHSVVFKNGTVITKEFVYWSIPEEIRQNYDEDTLTDELKEILISVVRDRCDRKKIGVLLSGGLDSRLIMASIPENIDCLALTFSDNFNREARIAKKVAECYHGNWQLLTRDSEFLGDNIVGITNFVGCECEWISAHAYGFANQIAKCDIDILLSGQMFDSFLKAYFAFDFVKRKPKSFLLPVNYEKRTFIYEKNTNLYIGNESGFWNNFIIDNVLSRMHDRRKEFYDITFDKNRGSIELYFLNPFSQFIDGATWIGDRRILPIQLVGFDRRLLDFAFRCPIELKLGGKIFLNAAMKIYGKGARIRNANDGVRPGSSHLSRLVQRAARKGRDRITRTLEKIGKSSKVQHSWSNYGRYWRESEKLKGLIDEHGKNLQQFNGQLFINGGYDILENEKLNWRNGFRLLHMAVWTGILKNYHKCLGKQG